MKILYIGTSEFAVIPLEKLIENRFNIAAVITQPDKVAGRGKKITFSPVKNTALKYNLKILQPENINSKFVQNFIMENKINIGIVVSYGQIIKKEIFNLPEYRMINIHPSLLPKYRGPSPIQSTLLNGDKKSGVTIIKINEKMDAGDILLQKEIDVDINDNYFTLHNKLSLLGAELLIKNLTNIKNIKSIPQNEKKVIFCKLIKKEHGLINWNKSALEIHNQVRALVKWPVAYTFLKNKLLKIYQTKLYNSNENYNNLPAGSVIRFSKKSFGVICGDKNILEILQLQLQGKKLLKASDFLNGISLKTGDILG